MLRKILTSNYLYLFTVPLILLLSFFISELFKHDHSVKDELPFHEMGIRNSTVDPFTGKRSYLYCVTEQNTEDLIELVSRIEAFEQDFRRAITNKYVVTTGNVVFKDYKKLDYLEEFEDFNGRFFLVSDNQIQFSGPIDKYDRIDFLATFVKSSFSIDNPGHNQIIGMSLKTNKIITSLELDINDQFIVIVIDKVGNLNEPERGIIYCCMTFFKNYNVNVHFVLSPRYNANDLRLIKNIYQGISIQSCDTSISNHIDNFFAYHGSKLTGFYIGSLGTQELIFKRFSACNDLMEII